MQESTSAAHDLYWLARRSRHTAQLRAGGSIAVIDVLETVAKQGCKMPTMCCESSNCLAHVRAYEISQEAGAQQGGLALLPLQQCPLHGSGPGGHWQCDCHQCLDQSLISAQAQCCSQARPVDCAHAPEPSCWCVQVLGSESVEPSRSQYA